MISGEPPTHEMVLAYTTFLIATAWPPACFLPLSPPMGGERPPANPFKVILTCVVAATAAAINIVTNIYTYGQVVRIILRNRVGR